MERKDCLYAEPTLGDFFRALCKAMGTENCLHITNAGYENYAVPSEVAKLEAKTVNEAFQCEEADLLILDLPLNWKDGAGKYPTNHEFDVALHVLPKLSDQGLAFLTVGVSGLGLQVGQRIQADLQEMGLSVVGYIELPKPNFNIGFHPLFQPLLAIVSKSNPDGLFTASISDVADEPVIAHSLLLNDLQAWADNGFLSDATDFRGFRVARIRTELQSLLKSESGFQLYRLGDFISESSIERRKQAFDLKEADVAISRILGGSDRKIVLTHVDELNFKHEWIVASLTDGLLPSYFKMFMNSDLGRMCLEIAADGSAMRFVSVKNLLEIQIPIPSIDTQRSLVSTQKNLETLQSQISRLEKELVFNPKNVDVVSNDVVSLLGSIGRLTAADEIKARVRSGESKTTEFKETLSWDVRKQEKAKYIETAVLKTVAGFLNTDGGMLLVGVSDDGSFPGLEAELNILYNGNTDKFLLHFKNLINSKVGAKFYPNLDWSVLQIETATILVVEASASSEPCFIDDAFYVRTNPSTDQLTGEKQFQYMTKRFSRND